MNNTQAPAVAGPTHSVPAVSERSRASYHGIGKAGEHPALMCLNNAALALEKAKTLPEIKDIHDIATAAVVYARAAKIGGQAAFSAEEIKLRAERKAGGLLARLDRNPGPGRGKKKRQRVSPWRRLSTLMRPSQPVLHFCPFLNQRVCSATRSLLLLERLGTETHSHRVRRLLAAG
jgi:hypothetical protein